MQELLNYELRQSGLNIQYPQFTILMILSKKEGLTQTEIAESEDKDKAAVSRNISLLEKAGYVKREADGGKKKRLFLTDKGKELIPTFYQIATKNKEAVMEGFSEEEKETIMASLERMFLNVSRAIEGIKQIDEIK